MEIREVGKRGVLFTFEFGDSVYLIKGKNKLFLCDTNEGKNSMEYIKRYIAENHLDSKELFIFNSHSDWDHIWGNYAFDCDIIAHKECLERMYERAEYDLEVMKAYHEYGLKIKYPTIIFEDKLLFADEGVSFIYAPSHTRCHSVCFDLLDNVMYAGDIFESPLPYLNYLNLSDYKNTIEMIKQMDPGIIITTHSNIIDHELVERNYQYICDMIEGKILTYSDEFAPLRHRANLKNMLVLKYDEKIKDKSGINYVYSEQKLEQWNYFIQRNKTLVNKRIWDIRELSYMDLEEYLKEYYFNL